MSALARRRLLLLISTAPLMGATTAHAQQQDDCDPRRRGTFRYFRCRNEYPRRIEEAQERLRQAEVRVERALQERARLRSEVAVLERTLASAEAQTRSAEIECRALQTSLNTARSTSRHGVENYVSRVQLLLDGIDRGAEWALAYLPPRELYWSGRDRYNVQRATLEAGRRDIAALHREAAAIWTRFIAGYITGEVAEELIQNLLMRIGARVLSPLVAVVATLGDIYDICVALYATYEVYAR